jgi:TolA-binding protein
MIDPALVVEAMKEMWSVVNGNQNRIEELETRIRELENRNSSSTVATQILEQDEEAAKENIQPELVDEKDSDAKAQSGTDEEEVEVRLVGTPSSTSTMATTTTATTTATTTSELDADSETLLPVQENNQSEPVAPEMPSDESVEIVETTLDTTNTTASSSESHIDPQEPHMLLESTGEADEGEIATSVIDESTANSE